MKKKVALLLAVAMVATMGLAGCGNSKKDTKTDNKVYAVEAGSAGEEAAKQNKWKTNSVSSQADALMEVKSGTSDAAIIDLLMAGAMIGEGTSYPNLKYTDKLTTEEYGVGCRKASDLASYINSFFAETYKSGEMKDIAKKYGVQEAILEQKDSKYEAAKKDSDVEYIKKKGNLVVGITEFEPMDYKDDNDEWIGFDADMAKAFAKNLGVDAEFVEIDWDNKVMELDGKTIDCVWNGMTLTDEVTSAMACTSAYCNNAQVVVVPSDKADKYQDKDSLKDLSFAVESGSAGEKAVSGEGYDYTAVSSQSDALMEVAAGTSDAAVIDLLMAGAMVGKGTGYENLTHTVELTTEKYGVGFRKGSDLADKLNEFFKTSYNDGSMKKCAETYGVQDAIIEQK